MRTEVIQVDPEYPDPAAIERAAELLRAGRIVAFPTETVYGLGANALDAAAVERIYEAKGRPAINPVIVHVRGEVQARKLAFVWPRAAGRLARRFWPGPLTIVVRKAPIVPEIVTAGGPTVALRAPSHPVARALLLAAGLPIAAPSANRSNSISPTRAEHVLAGLEGRIDLILDGGPARAGVESTVVSVAEEPARLLRPGPITEAQIEELTGPLARGPRDGAGPLPSPGLLRRHYAPRTKLEWVEGTADRRAAELIAAGKRIGIMAFGLKADPLPVTVSMSEDPVEYASALYSTLHWLDSLDLDLLLVEVPPDTGAWQAVRDRLLRASAEE